MLPGIPLKMIFTIFWFKKDPFHEDTMYWTDRWLHGQCIADLAPSLLLAIPHR
jgi:hypothetical protein